ncbi:T9SS type A sorting domain-containing protein [candidate division KSB1 bacterium]|nr:T9SS type A sorting domain-containing protein [candidate division KSB1 bacterium]
MTSSNFGNSWYSIDPFSIPVAYYDWYGRTVHVAVDPSTPEHAIIHFDSHSLDDYRGITSIETYDTGISWNIRQPEEGSVRSIKAVFDNHRLWLSYKNYDAEILSRPALIAFDVTTNDTICSVTLPDSVSADFWCVNGDTCYVINSETGQYYRSNDRGMTWSITQLELNEYPRYWQDWAVNEEFGQLILAPDHQSLFFIYPGTGLIYSPDNGYSWEDLNGNLPTLNLYQLAYSTDRPYIIYVATDNGLFKRDYTTGIDWDGNKITQTDTKSSFQDFHLLNNYPNPFNPSTTIRYDLPHPGHVSLNIYNIRGQLIAALLDEHKPAGSHTAQWDSRAQAGAAASGVYYCRLTFTGDDGVEQVLTRKMVVVK